MINKETKLRIDESKNADYVFLISNCLNVTPQGGFDAITMKKRITALKELENIKVSEEIKLTAESIIVIKQCVKEMKWLQMHQDILDLIDEVEKL